jgi:hypothetical protein
MSKQVQERYVHTQQTRRLGKGISKKLGMRLETSSTGINLAVISYALCLENWHTRAIYAASNHINTAEGNGKGEQQTAKQNMELKSIN